MIEYLPEAIYLVLLVYCLIDCIQTDAVVVRNLPKVAWIFLILIAPLVGGIAWLVAGRPVSSATSRPTGRGVPWPSTTTAGFPEYERPRGPDDDPAFLARLDKPDPQHLQLLAQWEADLRAREERLRAADAGPDDTPHPPKDPGDPVDDPDAPRGS